MAVTCEQQLDEIGAQMAPLAAYILQRLGVDAATLGPEPFALLCRIAVNPPDAKLKLSPAAQKLYDRISFLLDTIVDHLPPDDQGLVRPPGMSKRHG